MKSRTTKFGTNIYTNKNFSTSEKKVIIEFLKEMSRIEDEGIIIDTINFYELVQENYPDILDKAFPNRERHYLD